MARTQQSPEAIRWQPFAHPAQAIARMRVASASSGRRSGSPNWHRLVLSWLASEDQVYFSGWFKAVVLLVFFLGVAWVIAYFDQVLPAAEAYADRDCEYKENQLAESARFLGVYFAWFIVSRIVLSVPCVAIRVARVRSQSHGFCRAYCVHLLVRDGPLFAFVAGSLLLWFNLDQSPSCAEEAPELYRVLKPYAVYSGLYSICCLFAASWHNNLLVEAAARPSMLPASPRPGAPPGTLAELATVRYTPAEFGDEDGKKYPAECAICLLTWEDQDVIKVTPCHHAFHEECLGTWLRTSRTCALCRQSLVARRDTNPSETTQPTPTTPSPTSIGRTAFVDL